MAMAINRRFLLRAATTGAVLTAAGGRAAAQPPHAAARLAPLGPKDGVAFLKFNENPYGPSRKALEAIQYAGLKGAYYADEAEAALTALIADRRRVAREEVVLSTGSSEVLSAISLAFGAKGKIVAPALYFDSQTLYAERKGAKVVRAPMKADLTTDMAAIESLVDGETSLVHLCNPNNPTGELLDAAALRALCRRVSAKTTVLVDEAYNEITDKPDENSMIDLVREGRNVIITRTFSKIYGMAGIRMGYAIAPAETARLIRDYVMTMLPGPALAAAIACYEDEEFMAYSKGKILEAREMVVAAAKSNNLEVAPSQTNFVFVKAPIHADLLRDRMEARGVMIRGAYGEHANWSRVSMGFIKDVERYVAALPEAIDA